VRAAGLVAERFHGFGRDHPERSVAGRFFDMAKQYAGRIATPKRHVESVAARRSESSTHRYAGSRAERLAERDTPESSPDSSAERVAG
jgi:hypothetical protein